MLNERNSSDYPFYLLSTLGNITRIVALHNSRGHHSHKLQDGWDSPGLRDTAAGKVHKGPVHTVNREKSADASKFLDSVTSKTYPWGMQTGTATMENSMEFPQGIKITSSI